MSVYRVSVQSDRGEQELVQSLAAAARATLGHQSAPAGSLSIVVTDTQAVRDLNRRFRGLDEPTDVLAFPDGTTDPDANLLHIGDVIIAAPIAQVQAERSGHSYADELALLAVHGVLHLLGHDHDEPENKRRMWRAQAEILHSLGVEAAAASIDS